MPSRKRRVITKSLRYKGFKKDQGGSHEIYTYEPEGVLDKIATVVSRGSKQNEMGVPLLNKMARQVKLSTSEFLDLVDCPMSAKDYADRLRGQGLLPTKPAPFRLTEDKKINIKMRLDNLMEDGCQDQRLYTLFGKLNKASFNRNDLEMLKKLEEQYA